MNITRITSGIAFVVAATVAVAPSEVAAQTSRANPARIAPIASAGCSGVSWARVRTAEGDAYPVVTHVDNSSPADKGGIKEGDIILAVNGRDAREEDNWFNAAPGEEVTVRVQRADKIRDVKLNAGRVFEMAPDKFAVQCVSSDNG